MSAQEETVDVVDAADRVTAQVTRREMRARRLRHRAVYVFVFNERGQLFVHRRTATKDVYPSFHDPTAGGVVLAGEDYDDAVRRELAEELGIVDVPLRRLFPFQFTDEDGASVNGMVYSCSYDGDLRLQADEIEDGSWMDLDAVVELATQKPMCPDSLEALRLYLGYLDSASRRNS